MDIAKHFGIPIINADSRQIYRELKIGTARPTDEQTQAVRHYFVGTLSLDDYYSASLFEQQVLQLLDQLFQASDYALLTGGSMMYIDAVCDGIDDIPTIDDETKDSRLSVKNFAVLTPNTTRSLTARIRVESYMP